MRGRKAGLSGSMSLLLGCVLLALAVSCAHQTPTRAPNIAKRPPPEAEAQPYELQVGDLVAVRFWGNPELDEEVIIRPDGRISLPFVDEVEAAGLTPVELDEELTRRYAGELKNPRLTVIVREVRGQRVYVGGEVGQPQAVEMNGTMTVVQAIQEAAYFLPTARRKDVVVIRTMPNGERWARIIDLRPVLSGQDLSNDIVLQPSDTIIVPRSRITSANQWMQQYFRDLLPVRFVATFDLYDAFFADE